MTDAQDEMTARRGEHWSPAALAHPHSVPTMDLNLAFLSVRDDAKLWERHKGEKTKSGLTSVSLHLGGYFTRGK